MTQDQHDAAARYVRNCLELNPNCQLITRTREYLADEGIEATESEIEMISFDVLFGGEI